jgi:hypothetical protein
MVHRRAASLDHQAESEHPMRDQIVVRTAFSRAACRETSSVQDVANRVNLARTAGECPHLRGASIAAGGSRLRTVAPRSTGFSIFTRRIGPVLRSDQRRRHVTRIPPSGAANLAPDGWIIGCSAGTNWPPPRLVETYIDMV